MRVRDCSIELIKEKQEPARLIILGLGAGEWYGVVLATPESGHMGGRCLFMVYYVYMQRIWWYARVVWSSVCFFFFYVFDRSVSLPTCEGCACAVWGGESVSGQFQAFRTQTSRKEQLFSGCQLKYFDSTFLLLGGCLLINLVLSILPLNLTLNFAYLLWALIQPKVAL